MNVRFLACLALLVAGTGALGGFQGDLPENWQRINALAIDPHDPRILYLDVITERRGGGLFKSTDGGSTWQALPKSASSPGSSSLNDPSGMMVLALVVSPLKPDILFAGTLVGPFKSTDGGKSWTPIESGMIDRSKKGPTNVTVSGLQFDPANPKTLYAGTEAGVFRSTDEGLHWTLLRAEPVADKLGLEDPEIQVGEPVFDPRWPETFYTPAEGGLLKTSDAGSSWRLIGKGLTIEEPIAYVQALAIDPHSPKVLLAGNEEGLFKSVDEGETWSPWGESIDAEFSFLVFDPEKPGVVYAGLRGALLRSENAGATWSKIRGDDPAAFAFDPRNPATIYVGTYTGLFKSTDRGETWTSASRGLPGTPQAAPGPPKPATDDVVVRKVFGLSVQIERPSRPMMFRGDFNGDGEGDLITVVTLDSKAQLPKDVTVLEPWGKSELPPPERSRALAILHRKGDQILGRFLAVGDLPNSWEPDWDDMGIEVVSQKEGKEALQGVIPKGDVLQTFTQAGIDMFLYWDGNTYRSFAPDEEP
jgi:photosystem II stability/assembly factor-like uncharacterized protein